jgi:hypothetical protein
MFDYGFSPEEARQLLAHLATSPVIASVGAIGMILVPRNLRLAPSAGAGGSLPQFEPPAFRDTPRKLLDQ